MLSFSSCFSNSSSPNNESGSGYSCSHTWKNATCVAPRTCTKCDETTGEALGHSDSGGVCSRCGENLSSWLTGEYTDEFNQPTGKKYMVSDAYGTFSNSATTNSKLYAALQIDMDNIAVMLWEYGNLQVKGTFDYESYEITILDENGSKHYFTGTIYQGGTRIYFRDSDRTSLLNLMKNNDNLSIYLKTSKYSTSTYLFTVETKGFSGVYNSIT